MRIMRILFVALLAISLLNPCFAIDATVEKVDEKKRTVSFAEVIHPPPRKHSSKRNPTPPPRLPPPRIDVWPFARLIILPRPERGADLLQAGELVDVRPSGKYLIVRRIDEIAAIKRKRAERAFKALPDSEREKIERARDALQKVAAVQQSRLSPRTMKVGDIGSISEELRIVQIVNDTEVRLSSAQGNFDFWLQGYPTKALIDGRFLTLGGTFKVIGTKRYDTAGNSFRTVPLVAPLKNQPSIGDSDRAALDRYEGACVKIAEALEAQLVKDQAAQLAALDQAEKDAKAKADAEAVAKRKALEPAKREATANLRLRLAKRLVSEQSRQERKERLEEIVAEFPGTKAAAEAARLLKEMKKK
jgi:hypothetical protein